MRRCLAVALAVTVLVGVTRATLAPPRPHTTVSVAEPTTGATLGVVDPSSSTAPIDSTSLMAVPTSTVRRLASTSVPLKAPASLPQATVPPTTAPAPAVPTIVQPGIYVIRIDGTGLRRLSGNAIDPSWAPNGQEVAYETLSPHTITIASLSGATRTLPGYLNGSMTPVWSPDSTQIEYIGPGTTSMQADPWFVAADGQSQPRQLTLPGGGGGTAWAPSSRLAGEDSNGMVTFNPDGSDQQVVYSYAWGAVSWSPDTKTLVAQGGGYPLLIGADGSNPRYLGGGAVPPAPPPESAGYLDEPRWGPDSHHLVYYESPRRTGHSLIWIAPDDGSAGRVIAQDMEWPDWSPAGNLITAVAGVDAEGWFHDLDVMDTSGANVRTLLHCYLSSGSLRHPLFSPDGQMVAFEAG